MVVDCGGGTVDLTTRELLDNERLGEITEISGDFCGSTYIDAEFIKYLERVVGKNSIDLLKKNHYGQMQFMVHRFCQMVKLPFTGNEQFSYELDIDVFCPILKQYVSGAVKEDLEENEWSIELDFRTIKSMFDPVVEKIIRLIRTQLSNSNTQCFAIFLVGGFSESKYLQKRIKQEFQNIVVSIPNNPSVAISHGLLGIETTIF